MDNKRFTREKIETYLQHNHKPVYEAVDFSMKKATFDIYFWVVNPGNGELEIATRTYSSRDVVIEHRGGVSVRVETPDGFYYLRFDEEDTAFSSAVCL